MRFSVALLLLSLISLPAKASAVDESALAELLFRMSHSQRELNYRGIVSFSSGGHHATYRLHHGVVAGDEYERLENLSGGDDLLRVGHPVSCIHPGHQLLRDADSLAHWRDGPGRYYRLTGGQRVKLAGREAVRIALSPLDQWRYGYEFDADSVTGILLASRMLDRSGDVLESFQFATIELGVAPPEPGQAKRVAPMAVHSSRPFGLQSADAKHLGQSWKPGWLPDGFSLAEADDKDGAALSYSDGLAVLSIFRDSQEDSVERESVMQRGATVVVSLPAAGRSVTVVGEVPVETARRVAASVDFPQ